MRGYGFNLTGNSEGDATDNNVNGNYSSRNSFDMLRAVTAVERPVPRLGNLIYNQQLIGGLNPKSINTKIKTTIIHFFLMISPLFLQIYK